ncbi:MAG: hypothetical protein MJB14_00120 [Spirochaetes bacterium]|nr:hypothetical protein [Spirochaetota bacterium]
MSIFIKKRLFFIFMTISLIGLPLLAQNQLTVEEVFTITERMAVVMLVEDKDALFLKHNLEKALESKFFKDKSAGKPITGIVFYSSSEGGFLVKGIGGEGIVQFAGMEKFKDFKIKGISGGAAIGGSKRWTVGLIIGNVTPEDFEGSYSGATSDATAAKSSSYSGDIMKPAGKDKKDADHFLFLVSTGTGFSAGAGGTRITFKYRTE